MRITNLHLDIGRNYRRRTSVSTTEAAKLARARSVAFSRLESADRPPATAARSIVVNTWESPAFISSARTYSGLAVLVKASRVVGCPVIAVMVSKSLSTCRMVNPESSAVAAMMRSGIDGPRC